MSTIRFFSSSVHIPFKDLPEQVQTDITAYIECGKFREAKALRDNYELQQQQQIEEREVNFCI